MYLVSGKLQQPSGAGEILSFGVFNSLEQAEAVKEMAKDYAKEINLKANINISKVSFGEIQFETLFKLKKTWKKSTIR
jgi:hypothetical protein